MTDSNNECIPPCEVATWIGSRAWLILLGYGAADVSHLQLHILHTKGYGAMSHSSPQPRPIRACASAWSGD